jgi:tRNA pseudouridine38-40 synthase
MLKKRNLKIEVEYDGTFFCGWQQQREGLRTVEKTIRDAFAKICNHSVTIYGSGRTDAGVHAIGQIANFYTTLDIPFYNMIKGINSILPHDIVVKSITEVPDGWHAQRDAVARYYLYKIQTGIAPPALDRFRCWYVFYRLDIEAMKRAIGPFIGEQDFSSFRSIHCDADHAVREIREIRIEEVPPNIFIHVTGDSFLRSMVRVIVGTLVEVGRKKILPEQIPDILKARNRNLAGPTAPAHGLHLVKVFYPDDYK